MCALATALGGNDGALRIVPMGMNFHGVRLGNKRVLIGKRPILFGNTSHRRVSPSKKCIISHRHVLRSVLHVGRLGVGTMHAYRCPSSGL